VKKILNKKIIILVLCLAVMTVVLGCVEKQTVEPIINNSEQKINQEQNDKQASEIQKNEKQEIEYIATATEEFLFVKAMEDKINISDWQIYGNKEYGFKVKYPENWYWEDYTEEFKHSMIGFYPDNERREYDYIGDIRIQKVEKDVDENFVEYFKNMFRDIPYMHDKAISKKNKNKKDVILIYNVPGYEIADKILVNCHNFVILFSTPFGTATDIMEQMANELLCL